LKLSGLAVLPHLPVSAASVQVRIGSEGPAYPGIAFRILDTLNYELAYAQPHTSGQWDALQYDPVFHGSNTWQLYHGEGYQRSAEVPLGGWFTLKVDFQDDQAAVRVDEQPPLVVSGLAHEHRTGLLGLWTFRPAYFADLRVSERTSLPDPAGVAQLPSGEHAPGTITEWFLDGFGVVKCEGNGILNLNRYLPLTVGEVRLTRSFETLTHTPVDIAFGFSDELSLELDGSVIFSGQNLFQNVPAWAGRGYVAQDTRQSHSLAPGSHQLTATLKVTEGFGWGMTLSIQGSQVRLLPAWRG
jgi:hypothetical protein